MKKLVLIDGNSIMNRAFYGIMGTTKDGKYTNAVYGFLAILFKLLEDVNPDYMAVAFDLKAPTERHKRYEGYKANRKGMPEELAQQMPMIKEVLRAMNIDIVEKEGYEGDDVLGTLSRYGERQGLEVTILSGDRDTFQLASDNITIRIPRTKAGKTETENYNRAKVLEEYGLEPVQLIEVKALQGDTSDNIPGVPGIGPKTAISLIQKYHSVKELYEKIEKDEDDLKGKQKENIVANKDMAELSRTLGEIDTNVPLEDTLENLKVEEWDKEKVLELFKNLNFNRYIDRFNLRENGESENKQEIKELYKSVEKSLKDVIGIIKNKNEMTFNLVTKSVENQSKIIKEQIIGMSVYNNENKEVYYVNLENNEIQEFKEIFEEEKIRKIVETVLRKVKLWDRRKASPSILSGGQKQRLATADALAGLPACLVLDEPTAMLDPDSRKEVINIVKELNRKEGMTIILITHHTDEVVDADRIVLMKDGKIIGDDIPKKIFADYELLKKAKMDIPPVVELGMRLEKQQIGLEGPVLQEQEMIEKIVKLYRSKCGGKKDAAR